MLDKAMENISSLYGYCLRHVHAVWSQLEEQYSPEDVQAGAATVFRNAVRYLPVQYLQGDTEAATASDREKVDCIIALYKQALQLSLKHWRKVGQYNMNAVQAGAATILIQLLQVNYPFPQEATGDEVTVSESSE